MNETLPVSSQDQDLDTKILRPKLWHCTKVPRPRPWHQGTETETKTLVKWTWVLSSLETLISRSQSKVKYTSICIVHRHQYKPLMCSRDHLSYGITQCYLPSGRGDSPDFTLAFTSTHFTVPQKVEGWVDPGTAVRVHNPCPRLYIAVVVVINTRLWWALILIPNALQSNILPLDHCDLQDLIEQGLTSHQTHYRSYRGRVFTGQMTQPTVSRHWRKIGPKD